MQYCLNCGIERNPKSKPGLCVNCRTKSNRVKTSHKYLVKLNSMGYIVHTPECELWDKSSKFDVTNTKCGHRFTAQGGNILNGNTICGVCGPKKRIKHALEVYKTRYGRKYDVNKKDDYYKLVWKYTYSNLTINQKQKKSFTLHIDHIIPISWGFKNGAPPEMIADPINLRLLTAKENITKGDKIDNFKLLESLCKAYNVNLNIVGEAKTNEIISMILKRIPSIFTKIDVENNILSSLNFDVQIINVNNPIKPLKNHIILFSDEILDSSNSDRRLRIIVERLLHKAGKHQNKVFARKCKVKEITAAESSKFLSCNHFQGRGAARIKLGLFNGSKLVAVSTFSKPRFAKGYDWELIRYATGPGLLVVGGASKLLTYFKQAYPGSIITYSDKRWGDGNLYKQIGFEKISQSKPNYWWCKDGKRISRYQTQLKLLPELLGPKYDSSLSENNNMINCGWKKIEDLGNDVFAIKGSIH